jgi:hypothetical protein
MESNNNQATSGFEGNIATLKEAITVFKKYWLPFIVAISAAVAAYIIMQLPQMLFPPSKNYPPAPEQTFPPMILGLILFVIYAVVQVGAFKIIIDGVRGTNPNLRDLYAQYRRVPSYIFSSFMASIISIIGLFLFVFSFFPLTARYQFCYLFVIDKKVGMAESLRLSDLSTRGSLWKIIKFDIFLGLINAVWVVLVIVLAALGAGAISMLPLLGLIITLPLTIVAYVVAYKKFSDNPAQNVKESNGKMVGIIIALFIALFAVMIIVFGALIAAFSQSPLFRSLMESNNSRTMPYLNPTNPNSLNEGSTSFTELFKTSFVENCSQSGQSESSCTCMADYILANYSEEELASMGTRNPDELSRELADAAAMCSAQE